MPNEMTKIERIQAVIKGEELDVPPISMWRHFFKEEPFINKLTESLIEFQRQFDWDFAKINPRANFMVEDWGVKDNYHDNDYEAPDVSSMMSVTISSSVFSIAERRGSSQRVIKLEFTVLFLRRLLLINIRVTLVTAAGGFGVSTSKVLMP